MKVSRYFEETAWTAHDQSNPKSGVQVGAAVLMTSGEIYAGCNLELDFRIGMHAEVNAIAHALTEEPLGEIEAVLIAADAIRFLPCGGCLDWIIQRSVDSGCWVMHQNVPGNIMWSKPINELLPFYPVK